MSNKKMKLNLPVSKEEYEIFQKLTNQLNMDIETILREGINLWMNSKIKELAE